MNKMSSRRVLCLLTSDQEELSSVILLQIESDTNIFKNLVTMEKTRIFHFDPKQKWPLCNGKSLPLLHQSFRRTETTDESVAVGCSGPAGVQAWGGAVATPWLHSVCKLLGT
ncbi:hypothetical protein PoB_005071300 [Plakobranchus ocellatus]|uniref:Uncharacterized protein n=1 Tax=Plakobranchus ocellatus TaxID=259542 RepID=A0AAV4BZG1_9GAST|nr:hypothetical protein PoB_005071300 [Plakobranchus ocellatus]